MKTTLDRSNGLNAVLHITLDKEDYQPEVKKALKGMQKEANFKGFRKGKVPISHLNKLYGRSVLAESIQKKLDATINEYLKEEKIDILGYPLPNEGQKRYEFTPEEQGPYEFMFDLGLYPDIDLKGMEEGSGPEILRAEVSDDDIQSAIDQQAKARGERKDEDGPVIEEDVISLNAKEMVDGKVAPKGLEASFKIYVGEGLTEEAKKKMDGLKKGDTFEHEIKALEKDIDDNYVKKHYLQLDEDDMERSYEPTFQFEVVEITRLYPAEQDEEFFKLTFGEEVNTKEEAFDFVRDFMTKSNKNYEEAYYISQVREHLIDKNDFELPITFLKRWVKVDNKDWDDARIEKDFDKEVAGNFKWSLLRSELIKKYGLEVNESEVRDQIFTKYQQIFQGNTLSGEQINSILGKVMQDENEVRSAGDEVLERKLATALIEDLKPSEKIVAKADLEEKLKALYQPEAEA